MANRDSARLQSEPVSDSASKRVPDEIVDRLRGLILTGRYPPGSRLPSERELAKTLGVNRSSLREAIKELEHMGLVEARQGDGTRVTNFMETAGFGLLRYLVPLAQSGYPNIIRDALEFRTIYCREMVRLAAQRCDDKDIEMLRGIAMKAENPNLELIDLMPHAFEFYVALASFTRNLPMTLIINAARPVIRDHARLLYHLVVSADALRQHHRDLIGAFEAKDADRAAELTETYMVQGGEHIEALLAEGRVELPDPIPAWTR